MPQPYDSQQAGLYPDGAEQVNDYILRPGVCILPLAEDPPTDPVELKSWSPVVKLVLHAPYRIRNYRSVNNKQNNPPVVPAPADKGAFVFIGGTISFANALNATTNNSDWRVDANYFFVENCVSRNEDGFVLGAFPYTLDSCSQNENQYQAAYPNNLYGAVSYAGAQARVGYNMAIMALNNILNTQDPNTGETTQITVGWGYNVPSFFPGQFLNDELANAGPRGTDQTTQT